MQVQLSGTVPVKDYQELAEFARARGFVHKATKQPNLSAAMRAVLAAGLRAVQSGEGTGSGDNAE